MKRLLLATVGIAAVLAATAAASASPLHFAGLPPKGVKASRPVTGTMVISLQPAANTIWNVYADGRVIWQKWTRTAEATVVPSGAKRVDTAYVQRRLTPDGVRLLQSKVLATGLFEHNLDLALPKRNVWLKDRVRTGYRIVTVTGKGRSKRGQPATQAQLAALASLKQLVADPARWLPSKAWADSKIRAFVPAHYIVAFDRSGPDLSKLPPLARKAFRRYYPGHGCLMTVAHTRALLLAFARAGIAPSVNQAITIAFGLVGSARNPSTGRRIPSDFHFQPALPDDHC